MITFKKYIPESLYQILRYIYTIPFFLKFYKNISPNKDLKNSSNNKRVFLIGSGTSLKNQNLSLLKDENVIFLNNCFVVDGYADAVSGVGDKFHLIAPIHLPQSSSEWLGWFKMMEESIPQNVKLVVGLNASSMNSYKLIKQNGIFKNHHIIWYFASFPFLKNFGAKVHSLFHLPIMTAEAASIYGLVFAEYLGFSKLYLLGMDHDYFLYESESHMRIYKNATHQNDEFKRTFGNDFFIDEYYRQYKIFSKYKAIDEQFKIKVYNCSAGVLRVFERKDYDELF